MLRTLKRQMPEAALRTVFDAKAITKKNKYQNISQRVQFLIKCTHKKVFEDKN